MRYTAVTVNADTQGRSTSWQLFRMAVPVIGINVLSVLALVVDTAMCGRLQHAKVALTGLGYAVQLVFMLLFAMIGLTVGTVALIARAHGAGDSERANQALAQSTQLTILLAALVAVFGNLLSPFFLSLMGASAQSAEAAMAYLRPLLSGTVFYYLSILYGAAMRGVGQTRIPFYCALVANVLNFAFNYVLIFGHLGLPALGIAGSAIGTVLSQAINVTLLMLAIHRGVVPGLRLDLTWRPLHRGMARELFQVGIPSAVDMIILNAGFMSLMGLVAHLDEVAVAAQGVGLRIQSLAFVPGLAISQATAAMVGQALGAAQPDRARQVARASMVLCTLVLTCIGSIFIIFAHPLAQLFDVEAGSALEQHTVLWIRILGSGMFPCGIQIALNGLLSGAGATRTSLNINLVGTLFVQVPLAVLLGRALELGLLGVWIAFPIAYVVKAALSFWVFRRGNWAVTGLRPLSKTS